MGGPGSGRHSSHCGKPQTKDSLPLDIRKIARKSLLLPENRFTWQWRVNGRQVATIAIEVDLDLCMELSYSVRGADEVVEQRVQTQSSPCHLGGLRHWFTCPRCDKRTAVLYARSGSFVCRQCGGLAYASQKLGTGDRVGVKANKLRELLGWKGGVFDDAGGKPKGMHWKTYQRLKAQHDDLAQVSLHEIGRKLGFLHKLLEA